MDFGKIVNDMLSKIFSGDSNSVIAVLVIVIAGLVYDRLRIVKKIEEQDQKKDQMVEEYYKATITIADAFNSLKVVLNELKSKL